MPGREYRIPRWKSSKINWRFASGLNRLKVRRHIVHPRRVTMSIAGHLAGTFWAFRGGFFAILALATIQAAATAAEKPAAGADLHTLQRDGKTFFALSLTPPTDAVRQAAPRDVVI